MPLLQLGGCNPVVLTAFCVAISFVVPIAAEMVYRIRRVCNRPTLMNLLIEWSVSKIEFVEFFGLEDLFLEGEILLVLFAQQIVAPQVELVLSPDLGVKGLGIVGIVVALGVGGRSAVEPDKDGEGIAANVRGSGLGVIVLFDHDGNIDVVGSQQLLDREGVCQCVE